MSKRPEEMAAKKLEKLFEAREVSKIIDSASSNGEDEKGDILSIAKLDISEHEEESMHDTTYLEMPDIAEASILSVDPLALTIQVKDGGSFTFEKDKDYLPHPSKVTPGQISAFFQAISSVTAGGRKDKDYYEMDLDNTISLTPNRLTRNDPVLVPKQRLPVLEAMATAIYEVRGGVMDEIPLSCVFRNVPNINARIISGSNIIFTEHYGKKLGFFLNRRAGHWERIEQLERQLRELDRYLIKAEQQNRVTDVEVRALDASYVSTLNNLVVETYQEVLVSIIIRAMMTTSLQLASVKTALEYDRSQRREFFRFEHPNHPGNTVTVPHLLEDLFRRHKPHQVEFPLPFVNVPLTDDGQRLSRDGYQAQEADRVTVTDNTVELRNPEQASSEVRETSIPRILVVPRILPQRRNDGSPIIIHDQNFVNLLCAEDQGQKIKQVGMGAYPVRVENKAPNLDKDLALSLRSYFRDAFSSVSKQAWNATFMAVNYLRGQIFPKPEELEKETKQTTSPGLPDLDVSMIERPSTDITYFIKTPPLLTEGRNRRTRVARFDEIRASPFSQQPLLLLLLPFQTPPPRLRL